MKLDLACGQHKKPGFEGVDIASIEDIGYPNTDLLGVHDWPWVENQIEELHCSHFIEHIPMEMRYRIHHRQGLGQDLFFWFFDQAYRVIKPGGQFHVVWPHLQSVRAFMDPTHRRFIPMETMWYLSRGWREQQGLSHYNVVCDWQVAKAWQTTSKGGDAMPTLWNIVDDNHVILKAAK